MRTRLKSIRRGTRKPRDIRKGFALFTLYIGTIWLETPARIPSIMYVSGCCTLFRCELPRLILGPFRTLIRGQSLDALDNFPRARLAPFQWDSARKREEVHTLCDVMDDGWTGSAAERARRLLENLSFTLARERGRHPGSLCAPVNECSHFVRCPATELNEIADQGEIGAARNGKKEGGSFTLFLTRPLFCPAKRGGLHAWTWIAGSELSKVNAPIERLFTSTSAVECELVCSNLSCDYSGTLYLIIIYDCRDEMYFYANNHVK